MRTHGPLIPRPQTRVNVENSDSSLQANQTAAMQAMSLELQALAGVEVSPQIGALLAQQQMAYAGLGMEQSQGGVLNLLQAQRDLEPGFDSTKWAMPAADYWDGAELNSNLDATFGMGTAPRMARAELAVMQAQAGLILAMQGAGVDDLTQLLGGGPQAQQMAQQLAQVAQLLQQQPLNMQALMAAAQQADAQLVNYAAPEPGPEREALRQLFAEEYGVPQSAPQAGQPYYGGGAFGNPLNQAGAIPQAGPTFNNATGTGAGARVLAAAQSQVGVREASGNNDGLPSQRYANGRREPWCADFTAWCFKQSGTPLPGKQRSLASVQYMEDQMKRAGRFQSRSAGQPHPGDIIFFANRGAADKGGGRHVGIVEKVVSGRVYTIEGNSGNRVARRSYDMNNARISGYGKA